MNDRRKRVSAKKPRIGLTDKDLERLFEIHATDSAAVLARRTELPYLLIYNIVHRRVMSVSHRHYMTLYGRPAPQRVTLKVDGELFMLLHQSTFVFSEVKGCPSPCFAHGFPALVESLAEGFS